MKNRERLDLRPSFTFSPESSVGDIKAFMDTYGVHVLKDGTTVLRGPLWNLTHGTGLYKQETESEINRSLEIRLFHCDVTQVEDHRLSQIRLCPRWPFYVYNPLTAVFYIKDQWWQYNFTPGKLYKERTMEREAK